VEAEASGAQPAQARPSMSQSKLDIAIIGKASAGEDLRLHLLYSNGKSDWVLGLQLWKHITNL